jgi:hypothetical protein
MVSPFNIMDAVDEFDEMVPITSIKNKMQELSRLVVLT